MTLGDGTEPVADDEMIYRRIPASQSWYHPRSGIPLAFAAFKPTKHDQTGLSVKRAKYIRSIEDAARNPRGASYYIAVLRVGDLRAHGLDVIPCPLPGDPGHAELPALHYQARYETQPLQVLLSEKLCIRVEGPFSLPTLKG